MSLVSQDAPLPPDVRAQTAAGLGVTFSGQALRLAVQLASAVILARLVEPADYGILGMVAPVVGFLALVRGLGLETAAYQDHGLSQDQLSGLFWVSLGASCSLALLVAAASPLLGALYAEPAATRVCAALSAGFVFSGAGLLHTAILKRRLEFARVELADVASLLAGLAVGATTAALGMRYWSLVWMSLATSLSNAALLWTVSGWRPNRPPTSLRGLWKPLALGAHLTAGNVTSYAARQLDNVLIGWRWGPSDLGLYTRAYALLLLPLQCITHPAERVGLPILCRLHAEGDSRFTEYYLRLLSFVGIASGPLGVFLFAAREGLVVLALGSRWLGAAHIFGVLGLTSLVQPLFVTTSWAFTAKGEGHNVLRLTSVGSLAFIASFIVGLPYGAVGVAAGYTCANILVALWAFHFLSRRAHIGVPQLFRALLPNVTSTLAATTLALMAHSCLPTWDRQWSGLAAAAALACAVAVTTAFLYRDTRREIVPVIKTLAHRASAARYGWPRP